MRTEKDKFQILSKKYNSVQQAILITLLYSDIFSFPLTKDELWKFLITEKKISRFEFEESLDSIKKLLIFKDGYYCLTGRLNCIEKRSKNVVEVEKKMRRARMVAQKLSIIPSILFIGVSGGLAVGNAQEKDDIDLVVITRSNTLFVSRFLVLLFLELLGMRRSRNQKEAADKMCVNLLFDETALGWFGNHKDMYTAREIAQLMPLFEKENIYQRFINANKWIGDFLPNVSLTSKEFKKKNNGSGLHLAGMQLFESVFRWLQMSIIKLHQTNEIATKHILAFHPHDYRVKTLKQLRLKMRQFGLLTKF